MTTTYFYRYRSTFGQWRPAKSYTAPDAKGPEGERRKIKDVTVTQDDPLDYLDATIPRSDG